MISPDVRTPQGQLQRDLLCRSRARVFSRLMLRGFSYVVNRSWLKRFARTRHSDRNRALPPRSAGASPRVGSRVARAPLAQRPHCRAEALAITALLQARRATVGTTKRGRSRSDPFCGGAALQLYSAEIAATLDSASGGRGGLSVAGTHSTAGCRWRVVSRRREAVYGRDPVGPGPRGSRRGPGWWPPRCDSQSFDKSLGVCAKMTP